MAFLEITLDTSWQDMSVATELADAYNNRLDTLSESERGSLAHLDPDGMTVFAFVESLQQGILAIAAKFADPDAPLSGVTDFPESYATAADALSAAGLTESGSFRRIPEGEPLPEDPEDYDADGWSYGPITDRDLAGPWLFSDLQTALAHLTRRVLFTPSGDIDSFAAFGLSEDGPIDPDTITYSAAASGAGAYISATRNYGSIVAAVNYATLQCPYLSSVQKNVRLLGLVEPYFSNPYSDFGLGLAPNEVNILASFLSTASTEIYADNLPSVPSSWSADVLSYVPAGDFVQRGLLISGVLWVVDYAFSP